MNLHSFFSFAKRIGVVAAVMISLTGISIMPVFAATNLLQNGNFTSYTNGQFANWSFVVSNGAAASLAQDTTTYAGGSTASARMNITTATSAYWSVELKQSGLNLTAQQYTVIFWAKADTNRSIAFSVQDTVNNTQFTSQTFNITTSWQQYVMYFTMTAADSNAYFAFKVGNATGNVWVDSVDLGPSSLLPTYYYVSTSGSDTNNGLSASSPWKTLTKVNTVLSNGQIKAGDVIQFNSGQIFNGNLVIPKSGSAGNVITFTSYGTGNSPIITVGSSTHAIDVTGSYLSFNNLTVEGSTSAGMELRSGASNVSITNCTFTQNTNGFVLSNSGGTSSQISLTNDHFDSNTGNGFYTITSNGVTVTNATASNNGGSGMYIGGTAITDNQNMTLSQVTVNNNANYGIYTQGASNMLITQSNASSNADDNIAFNNAGNNATVSYTNSSNSLSNDGFNAHGSFTNITFDHDVAMNNGFNTQGIGGPGTDGDGYSFHDNTSGIIRYSTAVNNRASAIANIGASQVEMYYNLLSENAVSTKVGIVYFADGTGSGGNYQFYNNVVDSSVVGSIGIYQNGMTLVMNNNIIKGFATGIQTANGTITEDYNDVYGNTNNYVGLSAGTHDISADPLFVNEAGLNFAIQSGSPCINAGVNLGFTTDFAGNSVTTPPDIGAYEYVAG